MFSGTHVRVLSFSFCFFQNARPARPRINQFFLWILYDIIIMLTKIEILRQPGRSRALYLTNLLNCFVLYPPGDWASIKL